MMSRLLPILLLALPAAAQQPQERLLLPIAPATIHGANGSIWRTELVLSNIGSEPIDIAGHRTLAPGTSLIVDQLPPCPSAGAILLTSTNAVLSATLRSRDLSRQAETWGTSIPVVTSRDYRYANLGLDDVPMTSGLRSMLRIYGLDLLTRGPGVDIRFYRIGNQDAPNPLLLEIRRGLAVSPVGTINTGQCASSIEIPLDQFPELRGAGRIRIEVDSIDNARPYWAFVSVTHNESQHVTVIVPH